MTNREFWTILSFLFARLVGMIILAVITFFVITHLTTVLAGADTNDALTTLLGIFATALASALGYMGVSLSRDITEYLERARKDEKKLEDS